MIVLTFKPRFSKLVEAGKKLQTIRPVRKRPIKPGDQLSLREWTGKPYRSKQRVLGEAVCCAIRQVEIWPASLLIAVSGQLLDRIDDKLNFAQADGFADDAEMCKWFSATHGSDKFEGVLIKWKNKPTTKG